MKLYPLKFTPLYKERIWGGNKLNELLNKKADTKLTIGESWELSGVENSLSVVSNA